MFTNFRFTSRENHLIKQQIVNGRRADLIVILVLVIGLYFPTSSGGVISKSLYFMQSLIVLLFMFYYIVTIQNPFNTNLYPSVGIHLALWLFTIISHLVSNVHTINFGGYLPYIVFSVLLLLDLKIIYPSELISKWFIGLSVINIFLGFCIVFDLSMIKEFFLGYYAFGNEDVLTDVLSKNQPVLFFGSHSIASFYYYLFFFLSLKSFARHEKKIYLIIALLYMLLIALLFSVSSYVFLMLAIFNLSTNFKSIKYTILTGSALLFTYYFKTIIQIFNDFIQPVFLSGGAGFLGRYSSEGVLVATFQYIRSHPFLPTGLCVSDNLYTTDSGLVLNLLLGSIILVVLVYGGFFIFLYRNLKSRASTIWIFFVYLVFEVGYPNLFYARTWYLLPFIIVYLNTLEPNHNITDRPAHL